VPHHEVFVLIRKLYIECSFRMGQFVCCCRMRVERDEAFNLHPSFPRSARGRKLHLEFCDVHLIVFRPHPVADAVIALFRLPTADQPHLAGEYDGLVWAWQTANELERSRLLTRLGRAGIDVTFLSSFNGCAPHHRARDPAEVGSPANVSGDPRAAFGLICPARVWTPLDTD
jgi:hypothetical protein